MTTEERQASIDDLADRKMSEEEMEAAFDRLDEACDEPGVDWSQAEAELSSD